MREWTERTLGSFPDGWKVLLIQFLVLLLAAVVLTALSNRKVRPVDRGPALSVPMFLASFALLMIARHLGHERLGALIIAAGLAIAGLVTVKTGTKAPVLITVMLALLMGFGLNLSALVLFTAAFITLLLSRPATK